MKTILHIGCGGDPLPDYLGIGSSTDYLGIGSSNFKETRLDISEINKPDIVASMTDMGDIGEYDAVLCNHALEHLHPYEVPIALSEFLRVLKKGGSAMVFVPDLEDVKPTEEVILQSPARF